MNILQFAIVQTTQWEASRLLDASLDSAEGEVFLAVDKDIFLSTSSTGLAL